MNMTPERWQQIKVVLHDALELPQQQRSAFLAEACSGDPALRQEVESLLALEDEDVSTGILESSASRIALTPGTMLGEYEVLSLLGVGGMGEVYRARDPRLRRDVAIKVLPSLVSNDLDRLRRFEQEARAAAALNHPNILAVFQMGTYEGAPYLVSELLDGGTLREQLLRGPMPVRKTIDYSVQIARGLAAAHDKGIVHRDLKPENLFITNDGRVKILDFGLAKLTQHHWALDGSVATATEGTEPGVVMGTVGYMSPEQVSGKPVDHRADIFALGAIMYEVLTGKRAFQKPTAAETMSAILNEDPPRLHTIPPALQKVVHRCLDKNPAQRFQSASDLAFALEALSDSGVPRWSTLRENRRWWILSFGVALVLLVVVGVGRRFWPPTQQPRGTQARLTARPDEDPVRTAVISPDGAYIAYSDATGAYLKQIATGETHPLALPKGVGGHPVAWYPDSNHFLLQWFASAEEDPSLWVLSAFGGNARKVIDNGWGAAVSPDGSRIAFIRDATGRGGVCRVKLDCRYALGREIWAAGFDGVQPQRIVEANPEDRFGPVAWSPDGQQITYVKLHVTAKVSQFDVEMRDLRSGRSVVLQSEPAFNADAEMLAWQPMVSWTRDGRVIFAGHEPPPNEDDSNAWAIRVDAKTLKPKGERVRLTNGPGAISSFSITADGRRLAFIKNTLQPQVYVGDLDPVTKVLRNNRRLTLDQHASMPSSWTPDNHSVIFFSHRNGRGEVFKQGIDETTPELLASDPARHSFGARLSPDGSEIFYISHLVNEWPSPFRLMRAPIAGGPSRLLLERPGFDDLYCSHMPATLCIFGQGDDAGHETIFTLDPATARTREFVRITDLQYPDWALAPDGSLLAVFAPDPHVGRIRLFSMKNGSARDLIVKGWSGLMSLDWAGDSRSLFAAAMQPDGTIFLLNVDLRGNAHPLLEQKNGQICWAIPSSNGRHLASMLMNGESNAWMLENF